MPEGQKIGDWDVTRLIKFVKDLLENDPPSSFPKAQADELDINNKLTLHDQIQFALPQSTVGAAGGASALPATPKLYVKVLDPFGNVRVVPLFNP